MKKFLFLCPLVLLACDPFTKSTVDTLSYYKDERTNLCFAMFGVGSDSLLTNVPCTPEVLAIINDHH
jgi:hypothetical protein